MLFIDVRFFRETLVRRVLLKWVLPSAVGVGLGGAIGFAIHSTNDVEAQIPSDMAVVFVRSNCSFSDRSAQRILTEYPDVALVPIDLETPITWDACDHTREALSRSGNPWSALLPREYVCGNMSESGRRWLTQLDADEATPTFVLDGEVIATGHFAENYMLLP